MDSTRAISEALRGLVTVLAKSLQEFQDVEKSMLEVEAAAAAAGINRNGVDSEPGRALIAVAETVREMVGAWVSDLNTNAQVQKLMATAAGEHHGELMNIPKHDHQQSFSLGGTLELCNSSRAGKRARGKGLCKHSCEHHQEVVDPSVWRNPPQELVELVFAKLPLDTILGLCHVSVAWRAMSRSSNFCGAFSARFPKLFGPVGSSKYLLEDKTTIYDMESSKLFWFNDDKVSFPMRDAYRNSMFACDGGLVCFVPVDHEDLASSSVLVCDPSVGVRACDALPLKPFENAEKETVMVQLVRESDTRYKVIVVLRDKIKQVFSAHCFYKTDVWNGAWSVMESGLVYGGRCRVETGPAGAPSVFDCETKALHDLRTCEDSLRRIYAPLLVRDSMFMLNAKNFRSILGIAPSDVRHFEVYLG